jgi:hypothetical protein
MTRSDGDTSRGWAGCQTKGHCIVWLRLGALGASERREAEGPETETDSAASCTTPGIVGAVAPDKDLIEGPIGLADVEDLVGGVAARSAISLMIGGLPTLRLLM